MNFFDRLKYEYNKGSMVIRLIMINVAIFVVVGVFGGVLGLFSLNIKPFFEKWFAVHSNLSHLLYTPWSIVTSGFLHFDFWHLFWNMLWLYWIGQILEGFLGARKMLPIYVLGVIAGSLFFVFAFNVFPLFETSKASAYAIGASAGVMAIIWATVTLLPDHKIQLFLIGTVPLLYIAIFKTVLDLINISGSNAGGSIAHLGGALMGFIFIQQYKKGNDLSKPLNVVFDQIASLFSRRAPKLKVKYGKKPTKTSSASSSNKTKSTSGTSKPTRTNHSNEERLNQILDKINDKGYESLNKDEKAFLFSNSNKK